MSQAFHPSEILLWLKDFQVTDMVCQLVIISLKAMEWMHGYLEYVLLLSDSLHVEHGRGSSYQLRLDYSEDQVQFMHLILSSCALNAPNLCWSAMNVISSFLIVQDDGKETHCWIDWEIKTPVRLRLVLLIEFYLYWSNRKLILNNLLPMTRVFKGRCLASFPNFCPDGFVFWTIAKSSIMVRVSFTLLVMQSMGLEPNWYY